MPSRSLLSQPTHTSKRELPTSLLATVAPGIQAKSPPPTWYVKQRIPSLLSGTVLYTNVLRRVAFAQRPSRSRPRSSSSGTTQNSPSTSKPTSVSAMKSPLLPPSVFATRSATASPKSLSLVPQHPESASLTTITSLDCRLHHTFNEAHPARSRPWYLVQATRRRA